MEAFNAGPRCGTMAGVDDIDFAKGDGLVPCITQNARTGRVLMLAYMDEQALETTLTSRQMHYYSRSRGELWYKGETSGNTQQLVALAADCDRDTLLALVRPDGPACHTGETSCFFDTIDDEDIGAHPSPRPILSQLQAVIRRRAEELPEDSYTTRLLSEDGLVEGKLEEEAAETVANARGEDEEDSLAHELADLWYHSLVLANKHGIGLEDVLAELEKRRS